MSKEYAKRLAYLVEKIEKEGNSGALPHLREKGVECSLIFPLIEEILGFDAFEEISYEEGSESRNDQRFDFLIQKKGGKYSILIESKAISVNVGIGSEGNKQIQSYILKNKELYFGILTNGVDYTFFIQKDFIVKILQKNHFETPGWGGLLPVFTLGFEEMRDGKFLKIMSLFHHDCYEKNIEKLASLTYKILVQEGIKSEKVLSEIELNKYLIDKMENSLIGQRGDLHQAIVKGNIKIQDQIIFEDQMLKIIFEVDRFGKIILRKDSIFVKDFNLLIKESYGSKITKLIQDLAGYRKDQFISYFGPDDFCKFIQGLQIINSNNHFASKMRKVFEKYLSK